MANYMDDLFEKVKKKGAGKGGTKAETEEPGEIQLKTGKKPAFEGQTGGKTVTIRTVPKQDEPESQLSTLAEVTKKIKEMRNEPPQEKALKPESPEEEKSETEKELEESQKTEIDSYGSTKIYRVRGQPLLYYWIPVARPGGAEKAIINTIKEAATKIISVQPYRIRDPEQRRNVYYQKILEIISFSPELSIPRAKFDFYADAVVREMIGYGIIDSLIKDNQLEEIMVIGPNVPVYVFHRKHEMMITNIEFTTDSEIQDLINRIARQIGRRVDIASPLLDARLPDGSRVNATMPPSTVQGSTLTIRKFREEPYTILELIKSGTLNDEAAGFLWLAMEGLGVRPANVLIAGGTGSGKTTTLNVLASCVPDTERVISIEDTAELNLPIKHWIRMEARPPGLEGTGELTMDILTKNSLRMRPDRIIVGEIRHDEAFTLFTAFNTGHDGSLGTVHANSSEETIIRVVSPPMNVPEVMLSGLNFILIQHRMHDKKRGTIRRVTEIAEVTGALTGKAKTSTIYKWNPSQDELKRTDKAIEYIMTLQDMTGESKKEIEDEINNRAQYLSELLEQKVSGMKAVSQKMKEYIINKR